METGSCGAAVAGGSELPAKSSTAAIIIIPNLSQHRFGKLQNPCRSVVAAMYQLSEESKVYFNVTRVNRTADSCQERITKAIDISRVVIH